MKKQTKNTSANRIVYLNHDETVDPIKVVHEFFSHAWLPNHLKMLKRWRNDVAFESEEPKRCSPAFLVYNYELTIKLIEAAWLLKGRKLGRLDFDHKQEREPAKCYIKTEKKKLRNYPQNLSIREIVKPSSVLKKMFSIYQPDGYKKILHTWLHDALNTSFMEERLSKFEVITVYEQLVKLFEATWLIRERVKDGD
ncbi:hypothetical protein SAMN05421827_11022 [Pedobacter terrae]|uniref:Uncharacterized protein n=1 Tax=Pedobacter terrae TaxID=405671 RepID=A0A1G7WK09_9SPHI|nr:hypothetical protein [Pedobacter terrae]SDG72347.1 hypothetical protein SAMN05421827_11022 [Pedobacter terrae]